MSSFLTDAVDSEAILADIRAIVEIESPSRDAAGVNRVLETIQSQFAGTGAVCEREKTMDALGDILRVRCDPARSEGGILVLSHMNTVHPVGTLAGKLPYRREGDRVYGPGIYDMKGGLMLAVAAFCRIAQARRRTKLPITFLFTSDEELSSLASRSVIEHEVRGHRYVLVTEPARDGGKIVTARKGVGAFIIRTRGRPAHAGRDPGQGRSAITAMAEIVLAIEAMQDAARGITTNVGLIGGGTARNTVAEECSIEVDLRFCEMASASEMEAKIKALTSSRPGIETTVTGKITRPPFERERGAELIFQKAAAMTLAEMAWAHAEQTRIFRRFQARLRDYDLVLSPTVPVTPFAWTQLYLEELEGVRLRNYYHWLALTYVITLVTNPAMSLPCGVDEHNMPFGLQITGQFRADRDLLDAGEAMEQAFAGIPALERPRPDFGKLAKPSVDLRSIVTHPPLQ